MLPTQEHEVPPNDEKEQSCSAISCVWSSKIQAVTGLPGKYGYKREVSILKARLTVYGTIHVEMAFESS